MPPPLKFWVKDREAGKVIGRGGETVREVMEPRRRSAKRGERSLWVFGFLGVIDQTLIKPLLPVFVCFDCISFMTGFMLETSTNPH